MAAVGEVEELPNGRLESVSVEVSELSDARAVVSVDGSVLSSRSFKVNDNLDNDPASYEKFLLGEDSYWDDLGIRLKVLRLVSDSVIKGMVNAVAEEAAEKIALKEEELGLLHDRLQSYETDAAKFNRLESLQMMPDYLTMEVVPQLTKSELQNHFLDASVEHDCTEHLHTLEIMLEEQLQRLGDDLKSATNLDSHCRVNGCSSDVRMGSILPRGNATEELLNIDESIDAFRATLSAAFKQINDMFFPMKASICEHQWKDEFQREISTIMIRSYIKDLHNDFEVKLWEQKNLVLKLKENWQKRFAELSAMRQELDAVSKSLCSSEQGLLLSHSSHDFEEWNSGKKKDHMPWKVLGNHHLLSTSCPEENGTILMEASMDSPRPMLEVAEPPQLRSMTKEEVIAYYISEMIKMRRQHDLVLQEKTEELFSLKREFLKEKGSSPFRKDREFEFLKKRIPDILLKLDSILLDSEKLPSVNNNQEELCSLKNKIDTLFFENQHLRGLLADKRKEVMCLSSQVSDAASQMSLHSSEEASFIRQIKKLKWDVKDMLIEAYMREELHKDIFRDVVNKHRDILRDFVGEHKSVMEGLEIQNNIMQEVFSILFRGVVDDVMATINPVMLEHDAEKASLEAVLLEKEKALCLEVEEKEKLKQDITSLLEEKENFASEAGSTLMQQEQQFDLVRQELIMLRDKVSKQDIMILEKKVELDSVKARLVQTLQKINQYEIDIERLNHKNRIIWESLEEAEKENTMLHRIIEEKQSALESSDTKEKEQEKAIEYIANSVTGLSKAVADFENRLAEILGGHEHRLDGLSHQCDQLSQQANLLKKKGALYKHILDIKCSNLQKAEAEVDLLGDEVDALLSLLGKIYIALDHYSPVLQHYPGVMEILKLVQRELKGENNELV